MNYKIFSPVLLLFLFISVSCKAKKDSVQTAETRSNIENNDDVIEDEEEEKQTYKSTTKTEMGGTDFSKYKKDPVTILTYEVKGNQLHINVEYKGGCGTHAFTLYGSSMVLKSKPPQRPIYLSHETNGDKCDKMVQETLVFDIKSFTFQKEPGYETILLLNDASRPITYKYE